LSGSERKRPQERLDRVRARESEEEKDGRTVTKIALQWCYDGPVSSRLPPCWSKRKCRSNKERCYSGWCYFCVTVVLGWCYSVPVSSKLPPWSKRKCKCVIKRCPMGVDKKRYRYRESEKTTEKR
jgi:hypothetical protein